MNASTRGALKKKEQLGENLGTANRRLNRLLLFHMVKKYNEDICFRCGLIIDTIDEFSIEHKIDWLDNSPHLYWDLDNITFSHRKCNKRRPPTEGTRGGVPRSEKHGIRARYDKHGCRCGECKAWKSNKMKGFKS